jgi:hypothetical protein
MTKHRDCSINDTMSILIMTLLIMTKHRDCSINYAMAILIMTLLKEPLLISILFIMTEHVILNMGDITYN